MGDLILSVKKGTAISNHILTCDIYKSELKKFAGDKPTPSQRINFHLNRFKPIATNFPFSDERKRFKAIAIKIFNPLLNKQIDRKAVSIIWDFSIFLLVFQNGPLLPTK